MIHSTTLEVTEEGTVAAAATAVMMGTLSIEVNPVMELNRPFYFAIVDTSSMSAMFSGRVSEPELLGMPKKQKSGTVKTGYPKEL